MLSMNSFKNKWLFAFMSGVLALSTAFAADDDKKEKKPYEQIKQDKLVFSAKNIKQRTAPVGSIYVEGDDVPSAAPPPVAESSGPRNGEQVYTSNCSACHAGGVGGAPKFGTDVWNGLAANVGVDGLLQSVINGKGIMPPKGGCANCSDDELKLAVEHMISSAQ